MIKIKPSKEIVAGREYNNKTCEHCNSRKEVYEVTIDAITSRIIKIYLCKECLKELNSQIENKMVD